MRSSLLALGMTSIVWLAAAEPASAAGKKTTLLATGNTIAGPGRVTIDPEGYRRGRLNDALRVVRVTA